MKHYTHLTVLAIWMSGGKSFHALTVAILNARSPNVMSLVLDSSKRRGASNDWILFRFTYDSIIQIILCIHLISQFVLCENTHLEV